ncbi:MAG: aminoglycoside 6-adenylyltransferase [Candidatus Promineifilaceae bacterium]
MFEQERVLVRLQQLVLRDEDIVACLLTGSYGRATQDAYSDLDVVLVFEDEQKRDAAFTRRTAFAQDVMPYLPAKSCDGGGDPPFLHVAIYSNGAKVDFRYVTKDSLSTQEWMGRFRILKDSDGWVAALEARTGFAASAQPPAVSAQLIANLDSYFWVTFMEVYRLLLRGDRERPFVTYLQLVYETIPPLLQLLPSEHPAYQALVNVHYGRDIPATLHHLRLLANAYIGARTAVIHRHSLLYAPNHRFEEALNRLIERSG